MNMRPMRVTASVVVVMVIVRIPILRLHDFRRVRTQLIALVSIAPQGIHTEDCRRGDSVFRYAATLWTSDILPKRRHRFPFAEVAAALAGIKVKRHVLLRQLRYANVSDQFVPVSIRRGFNAVRDLPAWCR